LRVDRRRRLELVADASEPRADRVVARVQLVLGAAARLRQAFGVALAVALDRELRFLADLQAERVDLL
jgi:hypothetical protein